MASPEPAVVTLAALSERVRAAVEAVAATDPNPADPFRGLYVSDELAVRLANSTDPAGVDGRLQAAAGLLGLDALDTAVLALCAAPELSPRFGRLYGYLHDDMTRQQPSPRLVARLLEGEGVAATDVLASFAETAPLRRLGAIRLADDKEGALADRGVRMSERLAAYLLGVGLDRPDAGGRLRFMPAPALELGRTETVDELRRLLSVPTRLPLLVAGPDAFDVLAAAAGRPLVIAPLEGLGDDALAREAALAALLGDGLVCFDGLDALDASRQVSVVAAMARREERTIVCARTRDRAAVLGDATLLVVDVPPPTLADREGAWATLTGSDDVRDVAAKFRLSIHQIGEAAEAALLAARTRGAAVPSTAELDLGAREASSGRLGELAARLVPRMTWQQLVLPVKQLEVLRSISAYLRHRDLVLSSWGYERTAATTQGLKVLFAGDSGTGKTMAAQVLARELGLEIFRLDLATVVSKYIGETEKNLDRIFAAADGSNAILFFDEADAMFGKRSEVRDAHDRYANIEVAYLLQRMETYAGCVILATNFRQNIDEAFLRRLDFVIDFPFPEPDDRERIWRLHLPDTAPISDDVDVSYLAGQFRLSGGNIKNASLAAAFLAADDGQVVTMRHLLRGVAYEYAKLGRLTLETEFSVSNIGADR